MDDLPDPRVAGDPRDVPAFAAELHALAARSLSATTAQDADRVDATIVGALARMIECREGSGLALLLERAPTLSVHRHLWRVLSRVAAAGPADGAGLAVTLFAIPLVIVAGATGTPDRATLPGVLPDADGLAAVLREHGALAGNRTITLANALVREDAIDIAELPRLLASRSLARGEPFAPLELPPAPLDVAGPEGAHLRFLVGSALAAPGAGLLRETDVGRWGMPLARSLIAQLALPGVPVVALPRPAMSLPAAVVQGRAARREVSAQLFASSALRELRASAGEPVAIISAHRTADATGGGELRLSLSSALSPRDAQGFRCPLYPADRVSDVAGMLVDLLRDCRVADIRVLSGVHADREPVTGGPLLFKPGTVPDAGQRMH